MKKIFLFLIILFLIPSVSATLPETTGGTKTTDGAYTIHTFTSNGSFNVTGIINATILVVAGGGGGGGYPYASGGGAGGIVYNTSYNISFSNLSVVIGGGGIGVVDANGTSGQNSTFDTKIIAIGGAGGVISNNNGKDGGSSSGGGATNGSTGVPGSIIASIGGTSYGNIGGTASPVDGCGAGYGGGAGGGGSGGAGGSIIGSYTIGGLGGMGRNFTIYNGINITYSGGGGGFGCGTGGTGGTGGGGNGGTLTTSPTSGTVNTGGGGGGARLLAGQSGGNGGSGIVIIRYLTAGIYTNNITNDGTLNFSVLKNTPVMFNVNDTILDWYVNGASQGLTTSSFNYTFTGSNNSTLINASSMFFGNISWNVTSLVYPLQLLSPTNTSTVASPVTLIWREWPLSASYTYQIATDFQFINIVTTGTGTMNGTQYISATQALSPGTYYWHVKNTTSAYTDWFSFTISAAPTTPGRFNISVWDEQNLSKPILTFTAYVQNQTSIITKTSTTGWANFSSAEITSGEYLIIVKPTDGYSSYYQRMVLATSPTNVTMYVPNGDNNTINLVAFSLIDITGLFPYQTSTITVSKGGIVMDSSYFGADGTHPVYLISGNSYQITIQHGNDIFLYGNYIPVSTGTAQILTSNFMLNTTGFTYNISYDRTQISLYWNDTANYMSFINYTVQEGTPATEICNVVTSVKSGQYFCAISTSETYKIIFSALLTDGSYRNYTTYIDYTAGQRKTSTGISEIDGSPTGIGFIWNYGTFTMPNWVYNWISIILIIILAGSFGGFHSGVGSIITTFFALILESIGWFRPIDNDATQALIMGLTGVLFVLSIVYYMQHKDRGG